MIKPFEQYVLDGSVEKQLPDIQEAHALMSKAEKRLKYISQNKITEDYAEFAFEDAYDVMREAAQSLMSITGYKPLSHEAIIAYLRDKEQISQSYIDAFDRFRKLRNKSLYEAQNVSATKAEEAVAFATTLLNVLRSKIKP